MVKINDAKMLFATLVFVCGTSGVYAEDADVAMTVAPVGVSGDVQSNAPVDVNAQDGAVFSDRDRSNEPNSEPVTGKAAEFGVNTDVVVEISAPPEIVKNVVITNEPVSQENVSVGSVSEPTKVESKPAVDVSNAFAEFNVASDVQATTNVMATPSEQLLGPVESDVFKEMADIERETALLTLKAKRDRLLADIEKAKADLRKNQMDEMERREQIVRDRVKWEIEQEEQAKARAKAEAKEKAEEEKEKLKSEQPSSVFEDEEDITLIYTIREIKGVNGELVAVLNSERGAFDATVGYPLKNGFVVTEITPSTVKIKRGADLALLLFSEAGAMVSSTPRVNRPQGQRSTSRRPSNSPVRR